MPKQSCLRTPRLSWKRTSMRIRCAHGAHDDVAEAQRLLGDQTSRGQGAMPSWRRSHPSHGNGLRPVSRSPATVPSPIKAYSPYSFLFIAARFRGNHGSVPTMSFARHTGHGPGRAQTHVWSSEPQWHRMGPSWRFGSKAITFWAQWARESFMPKNTCPAIDKTFGSSVSRNCLHCAQPCDTSHPVGCAPPAAAIAPKVKHPPLPSYAGKEVLW